MVSMGRRRFGTDFQLMFRILKALLFLGFLSIMTVLFVVFKLTLTDLSASILAFLPTGWAILLVNSHQNPPQNHNIGTCIMFLEKLLDFFFSDWASTEVTDQSFRDLGLGEGARKSL